MDDIDTRWRTAMDDVGKTPEDEGTGPAHDGAEDETPEHVAAKVADDVPEDERGELREISEDKLKEILSAHAKSIETPAKPEQRADLSNSNLTGDKLYKASIKGRYLERKERRARLRNDKIIDTVNLQNANLIIADLTDADLLCANLTAVDAGGTSLKKAYLRYATLRKGRFTRANFQDSNLRDADLVSARLTEANFQNANLQDSDLSKARGLLAKQLASTNLSGAKLPPDIAKFEALDHVAEISRHARNNFLAVLGACVFSWLTIATTTDVALLTNRAETALPIIGTEVPIAGFYWAAPPILLALFLYLHLYLQRMWTGLASLPAIFPDGDTLDRRAYPWLLTSLVNAHVPLLRTRRPPFSRLMVFVSIIAAWLLVPGTLWLLWLRYLPRHDWFWTIEQFLLFAISIAFAAAFYWRARATLRGHEPPDFAWREAWTRPATFAYGGLFLVSAAAAFTISVGAIEGDAHRPRGEVVFGGPATWVPYAFDRVGYRTFANLEEVDVSTKPANWTGLAEWLPEEPEELDPTRQEKARTELAQVKGALIEGADLRHADAVRAFLANARLEGANLEGANLEGANLHEAHLEEANLTSAKLQEANLQGAHLEEANLQGADLRGANLTDAESLTGEQLNEACGDEKTKLPKSKSLEDYEMKPCPEPEQDPVD